jgi:hypothetical protein
MAGLEPATYGLRNVLPELLEDPKVVQNLLKSLLLGILQGPENSQEF